MRCLLAGVAALLFGQGASAHPAPGVVVDSRGRVIFVDFTKDRVMVAAPVEGGGFGAAAVFADGEKGDRFSVPHHLVIDAQDRVYVASDRGGKVWRLDSSGAGTRVYPLDDWAGGATFLGSGGDPFTVDSAGNLYASNERQDCFAQILKINPDGMITSLAGGKIGKADGTGDAAQFGSLHSACMVCVPGAEGRGVRVWLTEMTAVRCIDADGRATTIAGGAEAGNADGRGAAARFGGLCGIAREAGGSVLVADTENGSVRRVTGEGVVTTLAIKHQEGAGAPKRLKPVGVASGVRGEVFVLDYPGRGGAVDRPRVCRVGADGAVSVVADLTDAAGR